MFIKTKSGRADYSAVKKPRVKKGVAQFKGRHACNGGAGEFYQNPVVHRAPGIDVEFGFKLDFLDVRGN
jgi:hypothetical protein